MLQTNRPAELVHHLYRLRANPREERAIRQRGKLTAREYQWQEIIRRSLLPHLGMRDPGASFFEAAPQRAVPQNAFGVSTT